MKAMLFTKTDLICQYGTAYYQKGYKLLFIYFLKNNICLLLNISEQNIVSLRVFLFKG